MCASVRRVRRRLSSRMSFWCRKCSGCAWVHLSALSVRAIVVYRCCADGLSSASRVSSGHRRWLGWVVRRDVPAWTPKSDGRCAARLDRRLSVGPVLDLRQYCQLFVRLSSQRAFVVDASVIVFVGLRLFASPDAPVRAPGSNGRCASQWYVGWSCGVVSSVSSSSRSSVRAIRVADRFK